MHSDTAAQLRQFWKDRGNPPCKHPKVELESVSNRYLTGKHVCTTCGAILTVDQDVTRSPFSDRPTDSETETKS